jgi:hypothetical protein
MISRETNAAGWIGIICVFALMFFLESKKIILFVFNTFVLTLIIISAVLILVLRLVEMKNAAQRRQA